MTNKIKADTRHAHARLPRSREDASSATHAPQKMNKGSTKETIIEIT
ncbi:hypothetical protein [Ktedonobacter racemifer]|nr:hypothetical protein [Ktedonobacter racemifer]